MSEQNVRKFIHIHPMDNKEIQKDLKSAKTLNEFAEKMSAHGKKHGIDFTADHVKQTVKKEADILKLLKSKGISDADLQKVAGGSTIVICIGAFMVGGSLAEGATDQIESGAWSIPSPSHW